MSQTTLPWIIRLATIKLRGFFKRSQDLSRCLPEKRVCLLHGPCWYLLASLILVILHGFHDPIVQGGVFMQTLSKSSTKK